MTWSKKKTYYNGRSYEEDGVQNSIASWLRTQGYLFTAIPAGLISSVGTQRRSNRLGYVKGSPDIVVWVPGGTICIECKRPEKRVLNIKTGNMVIASRAGTQSEEQKFWQERVTHIPGHYYLVATDLYDVIKFFEHV